MSDADSLKLMVELDVLSFPLLVTLNVLPLQLPESITEAADLKFTRCPSQNSIDDT